MRALLDVNVLIALLDAAHVHHRVARTWLEANIEAGWASCPSTDANRLHPHHGQPGHPGAQAPAAVAARLAEAAATQWHEFWPDDLNGLETGVLDWTRVLEAQSRFHLKSVNIIHRVGRLDVGDNIVAIVVSAAHRDEAFMGCRHIIEELKARALIWKKEIGSSGERWVGHE